MALTRAKNTEFIIAVAKATMPKLVTDYRTMVASLEQAEAEAAAQEADDIVSDHVSGDNADAHDTDAVTTNDNDEDADAVSANDSGDADADTTDSV